MAKTPKYDRQYAGQTVKEGDLSVTRDRTGAVVSYANDGGASATSYKTAPNANASPTHQAMYQAAANNDWDKVGELSVGLLTDDGYGGKSMAKANDYILELQDAFGYNANDYYKDRYEKAFGAGSWGGSSGLSGSNGRTSGYGTFGDFLSGAGYDDYAQQTRKYIQAAVDNAVNGYNRQIKTVNDDTAELARQAYIANMMGQKNLDQQLSARGLAGGMADSQRIGLQANYENDLNQLERQRADTVAELQMAIENARLTGDMQTAQELASYLQQVQGQWMNYMQNQMQMENQNYWNQQEMENQNYWNNLNMQTENQNMARNWAMTLIQSGTMPDEATLTAAGMTAADAQGLLNYAKQQNAPKYTGTKTPKYTAAQAETAVWALLNGSNDASARTIVEGYYGMPYSTVISAYGGVPTPSGYDAVLADLQTLRAENEAPATINNVIAQAIASGQITAEEARQLRSAYVGTNR